MGWGRGLRCKWGRGECVDGDRVGTFGGVGGDGVGV